jgi:transposase
MNIQLPQVLSDITGETGLAIVRSIVAGERDGVKLAQLRDYRCHSSEATIAKALTGTWKAEHVFALKQALELFDVYTQQIAACDAQIQQHHSVMKPRGQRSPDQPVPAVSKARRKKRNKNSPPLGIEDDIVRITGVDVAAVDGIGAGLAQTILSEIGTDNGPTKSISRPGWA